MTTLPLPRNERLPLDGDGRGRPLATALLLCSALTLTACRHPEQPGSQLPSASTAGQPRSHGRHSHPHAHGQGQHRFEDAQKWAKVFDDPKRDEWQKPDEVVGALELEPTDTVADLGAGTGYFAARLAKAVPQGTVYAADIEPDMVAYLRARAEREKLTNLVPVRSSPDDAKLPGPVDVILVVDTYHHVENRTDYFRKLGEALRPGGRLVIIDFKKASPLGPPAHHKLSPEEVERELSAAGYRLQHSADLLEHQYFLTFVKADG